MSVSTDGQISVVVAILENELAPSSHSVANMADGGTFCFRTPKRRLVVEKNAFSDLKDRCKRHIDEHVFNHAVSTECRRCFAVRDRSETQ